MNKPLTKEEREAIEAWLKEWAEIRPSTPVSYIGYVRSALSDSAYWREVIRTNFQNPFVTQAGTPKRFCLFCGKSEHETDCAWKLAQE